MDYERIDNPKDKPRHRMVTLFSLLVACGVFAAMQGGWLGARLQGFALLYLIVIGSILIGRAVLTELGFRPRT
jgi:uncharacterized membrane protein YjjP (DUF1212 family)